MDRIPLSNKYLKNPKLPLVISLFVMVAYLSISYFHPGNNYWLADGSFEWRNFFQFIFIDQLFIEFFSFLILAWLMAAYASFFHLNQVDLSRRALIKYQIGFLPLFLIAFFFFNPVTQTIRYIYHAYPAWDNHDYYKSYFYSVRLYLTYLPLVLLGGYGLLNVHLYLNYKDYLSSNRSEKMKSNKIEARDENGKTILDLDSVISIERIGRSNFAFANNRQLRINYSLNELEALLPNGSFIRINRAAIINISHLKNYSFWENDKYILRLINGKEFIISRERIRNLKNKNLLV